MSGRASAWAPSKITKSANGEMCQIRLPGVCTFDRKTTVWAHANGSAAGKGIGMKSHDLLGSYACAACHDVYDRRVSCDLLRPVVEVAFWEGHARSLVLLIDKGIVRVERGTVVVSNGEASPRD
jgi:hypothetical protein